MNLEMEIAHRFVVDYALMRAGYLSVVLWLFEGAGKVVGRSRLGWLVVHRVEDPSLARRAKVINSL